MANKVKKSDSVKTAPVNAVSSIEDAKLLRFRLTSATSTFKSGDELQPGIPPELKQNIGITGSLTNSCTVSFEVRLELLGGSRFEIAAKYDVQLQFQSDFKLPTDPHDEFSLDVVSKIVWPFWREHVHYMLSQMQLPAIRIPLTPLSMAPIPKEPATTSKRTAKKDATGTR